MPWNTAGNIKGPKGDKGDLGNAGDIAALIHAAASKAPADADELPLLDSTGSWGLRKFTWSTLKSLLQSLFFYRGNILGTVSQSGGVPTGAIIQRGSNANGEFIRFADGTQICWFSLDQPSRVFNSGDLVGLAGWTFPAQFSVRPIMSASLSGLQTYQFGFGYEIVSISSLANIFYRYNGAVSFTGAMSVSLIAIGRWF